MVLSVIQLNAREFIDYGADFLNYFLIDIDRG
jgi:hypothetical protein